MGTITQDGHDGVARSKFLGQTNGARDVNAAGRAQTQAFLADQLVHDPKGFLVGNLERKVDRGALEVRRDPALTDALRD